MPEHKSCPVCGGEAGQLGVLGNMAIYQCRDCGMEFTRKEEE